MTAAFIGIDLAWQSQRNPSGAVALLGSGDRIEIAEVAPPLRGLPAIHDFIQRHAIGTTVIAIDAPLIITNSSGQRRCERELSQRFGGQHASCHSSNLSLYPNAASVQLATWLASLGFVHAIAGAPLAMLEVYPHAAYIALFELPSIIRYKRGSAADKCAGLRIVQEKLARLPIEQSAALDDLLKRDPAAFRGKDRKSFEDSLDALLCAFLAYHFWWHGAPHWTMFGDREDGYIANPNSPLIESSVAAA